MLNCFDVPVFVYDWESNPQQNISDVDYVYQFREEFDLLIAIFCDIESKICTLNGEYVGVAENVGNYCGKGFLVSSVDRGSYFIPCSTEEVNSVRELAENEDAWDWTFIDKNGVERSMRELSLFTIYTKSDEAMVLHEGMKLPPAFFLLFKAMSEGRIPAVGCAYMCSEDIPPECEDLSDLITKESNKLCDIFTKVVPEYLVEGHIFSEGPEVFVLCDINDYIFSVNVFADPFEDFRESAFIRKGIVARIPSVLLSCRVYPIEESLIDELDKENSDCDVVFVHDSIVERITGDERKAPDLVRLFISATRKHKGVLIVADGKQINIDSLMKECPKREVKSLMRPLEDVFEDIRKRGFEI